jgi:hypothetical protein
MKANSMPFYHLSSYTIKVYKGYYKEHGTNISYNGIEENGVLCFDLCQMLHQKTINSNIQIFPSFQIVVEFEFQT